MCTRFWSKNLKGRHHSEDLGVNGSTLIRILREIGCDVWTGFIWLRIGTSSGLL
jgi:hypothetical protein